MSEHLIAFTLIILRYDTNIILSRCRIIHNFFPLGLCINNSRVRAANFHTRMAALFVLTPFRLTIFDSIRSTQRFSKIYPSTSISSLDSTSSPHNSTPGLHNSLNLGTRSLDSNLPTLSLNFFGTSPR